MHVSSAFQAGPCTRDRMAVLMRARSPAQPEATDLVAQTACARLLRARQAHDECCRASYRFSAIASRDGRGQHLTRRVKKVNGRAPTVI